MNNPSEPSGRTGELPARVGVLGGGRMGAGIAHAFLIKGADVVVIERDEASAQAGRERVASSAAKSIERDPHSGNLDEMVSRLKTSVDYADFGDRELVVEAVPEDWTLKVAALRRVEEQLTPGAVLASNTSSLSVSGLAEELERPQDFLGLHFFNPVPASTLIEVVIGKQTRPDLVEQTRSWVQGLGKTAVVVNDAPGFASSRLGVAIALEAMRMVEEGVASAKDIDNAMVLGYKHPTGPLRTTDIVGLDVRLGIAEYLHETLGERFAPPQILREKVARGELGRKTGKGFFDWS
ncbi:MULTISPECIES: 3-hydroxyacyl-CoA dehydrogenase family protein [Micrococcales]|jgi:3-hydroxybutyryl-CoA dehydrogenase|nr:MULTISPECIES: 3-hydroxyacyl-CoA dehydrogenase family protein [Micrococcales]MBE0011481.1 3-hydroxyacyl-CoA dehydrogenase family protein [Arthrobacter sp. AET 35A]MCR1161074.1 3-hydroxyacyl-CoA dehydrogenase family protein [Paenarthrobacter sp. UW852]MDZ5078512.1 3-hydroxyacyl-CoA dehydrogenase family protein [Nesterenkonia sp. HG001]MEA1262002.1 3-hydroxyacyl-CoA dehydrogenase family protein [Microbacterium sp. STF-2]UKA69620.1 3-hydroxyacyl-CoA dehydrogenase family protein [Arthrobacter sp